MLTIVTPTRQRPEAFALLERWVAAQDYDHPFQWLVCNDGPPYDTTQGQHALRRRPRAGELHSLCSNLLHALPHVRGDRLLILEDDDYYAPGYLRTMDAALERAPLVGNAPARYYNVRERRWQVLRNRDRASLAQTGLRREAFDCLAEVCRRGRPMIDRRLWRAWEGPRLVVREEGLHVGIKGMPGTVGIGKGHRATMGHGDEGLEVFGRWGLPGVYRDYARAELVPAGDPVLNYWRGGSPCNDLR